jgi:hypothetical protein
MYKQAIVAYFSTVLQVFMQIVKNPQPEFFVCGTNVEKRIL